MSAQKSAPVAVTVITYLTRSGAQQGLFAVPALVGQLTQIFIGSWVARTFAKQARACRCALHLFHTRHIVNHSSPGIVADAV